MKVIIVGAGLFGSVAATLCRKAGHEVTVVDHPEALSASKCASGLFKPSWLESLGSVNVQLAYDTLRLLYEVHDLEFSIQLAPFSKKSKLNWIDPATILVQPDVVAEVTQVGDGWVKLGPGKTLRGAVLVAAGVWTARLVPGLPKMESVIGSCLRFRGQIETNQVRVFAPYKQAIAFNINPQEIWMGDGTAIVERNYQHEQRILATAERAANYFGLQDPHKVLTGARPYVEGHKTGLFGTFGKRTWVSTGGAKNGTLLAAFQARQFVEAL